MCEVFLNSAQVCKRCRGEDVIRALVSADSSVSSARFGDVRRFFLRGFSALRREMKCELSVGRFYFPKLDLLLVKMLESVKHSVISAILV